MLPCTSTEMGDVLMSASTLMVWWRKFDQDLKIQDPVVGAKNLGDGAQPKIIVLQLLVLVLAVGCGGANNIFHRRDRY